MNNVYLITALLLFIHTYNLANTATAIQVDISGGKIEGLTVEGENKNLSKFLGIPYAEPPIGNLRWKDTLKKKLWSDVLPTTEFKPDCPQGDVNEYSEDCLYGNVWTPKISNTSSDTKHPVIVWIHGGRFETGGSRESKYDGENLVAHNDVVVFTFNYRLGALGFMFFEGDEFTGNYGIKDQRLFLLWVSENAAAFDGDEKTTTLMGIDAGAASIGYLMMDLTLKDLFHRTIMLGGSPMMPWSITDDREYMSDNSEFFSTFVLQCNQDNQTERRTCLEKVNVSVIVDSQKEFTRLFQGIEFAPNIDNNIIVGDPWDKIPKGQFEARDLIIGATNNEGGQLVDIALQSQNVLISNFTLNKLLDYTRDSLKHYPRVRKELTPIGHRFLELHFTQYSDPDNGPRNFKELVQAIGNWYLTCPTIRMAQDNEAHDPRVYLYYFTEQDTPNHDKWNGASHGEDATYAFGIPTGPGVFYTKEQQELSERIMKYFVDFAATGKVSNEWPALNYKDGKEFNYYEFNTKINVTDGSKMFGYEMNECTWWTKTLDYVNGLTNVSTTTAPPTSTSEAPQNSTSESPQTTPPIGPPDLGKLCSGYLNQTGSIILGVLGTLQGIGLIIFAILLWKYCQMKNNAYVDNYPMY